MFMGAHDGETLNLIGWISFQVLQRLDTDNYENDNKQRDQPKV